MLGGVTGVGNAEIVSDYIEFTKCQMSDNTDNLLYSSRLCDLFSCLCDYKQGFSLQVPNILHSLIQKVMFLWYYVKDNRCTCIVTVSYMSVCFPFAIHKQSEQRLVRRKSATLLPYTCHGTQSCSFYNHLIMVVQTVASDKATQLAAVCQMCTSS